MDNNEVFANIVEEYEKLRAENERKRETKVAQVYKALPEIEIIDKKINEIGINTLNEILANPDKKGLKEQMHSKFEILKQQKKEILQKNSIPLDYDKTEYRCDICKDTGYVEGNGLCSCFSQKLIDYMYKQSNMNELLKTQTFENFSLDCYSKKPYKDLKYTPYENMEKIRNFCKNYVDNFDDMKKSLCFYGDTGLGKTFLSSCIAKELIEKGKTVLYIRAAKLFKIFEDERFGRLSEDTDSIYKCDMLIIDDLGTEIDTKFNVSYLFELINERSISDKKIIINTNLNFSGLEKKYTKRVTSRLTENFLMMFFYGEDIRRKKFLKKEK